MTRVNYRIFTNSPYMIFEISLKMAFPIMIFSWKIKKNPIEGKFVKIRKCTLVMFFVIFLRKWQFRLKKWKFSNFSEFSLLIIHKLWRESLIFVLNPMKACVLVNWAIIRYLQQLKLKKKILKMAMMKAGFDICVFVHRCWWRML